MNSLLERYQKAGLAGPIDQNMLDTLTEQIREAINKAASDTIFSNLENAVTHNPYDQEERMLYSIETGNTDLLKQSWEETYSGDLGITARDPVRSGKNSAQYVIFASARAAIRGGLPAEYAMILTDAYSQRVEELKDLSVLHSLVDDVQMTLTEMVRDYRIQTSRRQPPQQEDIPIVDRCKDYVFTHLHEKLTVQQIAEALGIHPHYLTNLFSRQVGVPLLQYILQQKIDLAKNMLTYSDYTYIEIANYLGFSSQSHLGATFKRITGMTLKQFRDKYHKEVDF